LLSLTRARARDERTRESRVPDAMAMREAA
jgi:hypothetical protein